MLRRPKKLQLWRFKKDKVYSLYDLLRAFENSTEDVVEIVYSSKSYKSTESFVTSLRTVISYYHYPYAVVKSGSNIYLFKSKEAARHYKATYWLETRE